MSAPQTSPTIEDDRPCTHCGYNLRGLTTGACCPECGNANDATADGHLLRHAAPNWLSKLTLGTQLKLWSLTIVVLTFIAGMVMGMSRIVPVWLGLPELVSTVLGCWGTFALTAQDPAVSLHETGMTLRRFVRLCAVLAIAGSFLSMADTGTLLRTWILVIAGVLGSAGFVGLFCELAYLRRFALRIPDPGLAASTRTLFWAMLITGALAVVGSTIFAVANRNSFTGLAGGGRTMPIGGIFSVGLFCGAAILALAYFLWYVRLLIDYGKAFRSAVEEGRTR